METDDRKPTLEVRHNQNADAVYGVGVFGAWVYYFRRASTNQERVAAFFKGLFWPAFVVHDLMVFLERERPSGQDH